MMHPEIMTPNVGRQAFLRLFIIILTVKIAQAQRDSCRNAEVGKDLTLDFNYTPNTGNLFSTTWFRGVDRSGPDQILYFQVPDTLFYRNGYNASKVGGLRKPNYAGLVIYSIDYTDAGTYEAVVSHVDEFDQLFQVSVIKARPFNGVQIDACGDIYTPDESETAPTKCLDYKLTIPTGLSNTFSLRAYDGGILVGNYSQSHCIGDPCLVQLSFDGTNSERQLRITLDLLLCTDGDSTTTFKFTIKGFLSSQRYYIAEIVFAIAKLLVIIPVCEFVILKAKKPANVRVRNLRFAVGAGVLVDIIVAVADIGAFYSHSSTNPDDSAIVLGVNLGLALGCSAVLVIYAVLKNKSVNDACDSDIPSKETPGERQALHGHTELGEKANHPNTATA